MRCLFTCGSLIIAATLALCNAGSLRQQDGSSLRISIVSGRPVVDGVFLNGQGPWRFLLDTGAQTNQVETSIAHNLGLLPTFRTEITTVAGSAYVSGGHVAEASLGSATATSQEFLFTDLDGIHSLAANIHGVLGQEFLSHFDYLLDFAGRRLVFGGAVLEGGIRAEMNLVEGRPTVETDRGKLVLDSGTGTAMLFTTSPVSGGRILTASGAASVSPIQSLRFRIAARVYSTATVSVARVSPHEDGLLPASLFHAVYISNSGKYLLIDPPMRSHRKAL
jgi:hypothetical protein